MEKNTKPFFKQSIPDNARCVFKGIIFDVYQWRQKLFDGSYTTFEKLKRPDTVMVIPVTTDKKILLAWQEQPGRKRFLSAFGGRVDKGENPRQAAERELLEESGYSARKLILWYKIRPVSKIEWTVYVFIAHDCHKITTANLEAGEKIKLFSLGFDRFVKIVLNHKFHDLELKLRILEAVMDSNKMKRLRQLLLKD